MHWWNGDWHIGWMAAWWILGLAVVALLLWTVLQSARSHGSAGEPPETLLKRRYAKGEIDRETYERMMMDLKR